MMMKRAVFLLRGAVFFLLGTAMLPSWGGVVTPVVDGADGDGPDGFEVVPAGPVEFVGADLVWDAYGFRGAGQRVAIVDTGLKATDLPAGKVVFAHDFSDDTEPDPQKMGHGTNVAQKVLQIAPDAELIDLRVISNAGSGEWEWVRDALLWALRNQDAYHITAINMSIGGGGALLEVPEDPDEPALPEIEEILHDFVADGFVAAAAGGGFAPHSRPGFLYPAISPYAVAVGSVWESRKGNAEGYIEGKKSNGEVIWWAYSDPDLIHPTAQRIDPARKHAYMLVPPGGATSFTTPYVTGASVLLREAHQSRFPSRLASQARLLGYMQACGVAIEDTEPPHHDSVINTGFRFSRLDVWAATQGILADEEGAWQPDLWIQKGKTWLGNDIYNEDGSQQTSHRTVRRGASAVYRVRLYNDGIKTANFRIWVSAGDKDWAVRYYWGTSLRGVREVTRGIIRAKGWKRASVPPGERRVLTITVRPRSGLSSASSFPVLIRAQAEHASAQRDTVQAITRMR